MPQPPKTLIILPCHSIYTPITPPTPSATALPTHLTEGPGTRQSDWQLAPFQYEANDHLSFLEHIHESIRLLKSDPDSELVMTGGYTKLLLEQEPISEGASYLQVCKLRGLLLGDNNDGGGPLVDRIHLEECARDSYENVLFSLLLWFQIYGSYPKFIKIVGFEFKRYRFESFHLQTLQWPVDRFEYIGLGPTYPENEQLSSDEWELSKDKYFKDLYESEGKFAIELFKENQFGCKGSKLYDKKVARDPYNKGCDCYLNDEADQVVLKKLVRINELELKEAMEVYGAMVKDKFDWCS